MALPFLSVVLPTPRICWRRECRSTSRYASCRAGFGHVTCYVSVLAPLTLAWEIASSTKPRAQRRCTPHEQGTYTKASSSTDPWQMLQITRPLLSFQAALVDDPPLPLADIARYATAIASAINSSQCCWSTIPSASSTTTVSVRQATVIVVLGIRQCAA